MRPLVRQGAVEVDGNHNANHSYSHLFSTLRETPPLPVRLLIPALILLCAPILFASMGPGLELRQNRVFDLGPADSEPARIRASFLEHMLGYLFTPRDVRLSMDERLQLDVANAGNLLSSDAPLEQQLDRLLRARWQLSTEPRSIPERLEDFRTRHEAPRWRCETLRQSLAKPVPRRICRHPAGYLSVAETLAADGTVRETEIAIARGYDSGWEFHVYDVRGERALESDFGDARSPRMLAAPQSCAGCHYDPARGRFTRRPFFAPTPERTQALAEAAPTDRPRQAISPSISHAMRSATQSPTQAEPDFP